MRKKTDHPPRSGNGPARSSDGEGLENDHYKRWSELSSTAQDEKVEQFFKQWQLPAADFADCPPEAELRKHVKGRKRDEWPKHVQNCDNCSSLAELISDPDRVRIPVSRILAEASRKAWENEHSGRRRSFTVRHVRSLFKSIPQHQRRAIFAGAAAVFVLTLGWIGYQYYESKPPSSVVAFDNRATPVQPEIYAKATDWFGKPTEILEAPNYDVEQKVKYLEPLQSTKPQSETTLTQASLDSSKRAEAGTLIAKYNNQVKVLEDSASEKNIETKDFSFTPTEDSKIVSKVWFAFGSTGTPLALNTENPEAAKIILEAAKFTKVQSIEPKADQKTKVTITLPKNEFDDHALNERLKLLADQGLDVKVAAYTAPRPNKTKM